jgi:hypothetical protein
MSAGKTSFPTVRAAVLIISRGEKIAAVLNPAWGAYTLPMTKLRTWEDPSTDEGPHFETAADAAIRVRTECIHGTCLLEPTEFFKIDGFKQSDRDGRWKKYDFHVFHERMETAPVLAVGANVEWLTCEEIDDESRRPISKTCRDIIRRVRAHALDTGVEFP